MKDNIGDFNKNYNSKGRLDIKTGFWFIGLFLLPAIIGSMLLLLEYIGTINFISTTPPYTLLEVAPAAASIASVYLSVLLILVYLQLLKVTKWQAKFTKMQIEGGLGIEGITKSGYDCFTIAVSSTGGSTVCVDIIASGELDSERFKIKEHEFLPRRADRDIEISSPFIHPGENLVPLYARISLKIHDEEKDKTIVKSFPEAMSYLYSNGIESIFLSIRVKAQDSLQGSEPIEGPAIHTNIEIHPDMAFSEAICQQADCAQGNEPEVPRE